MRHETIQLNGAWRVRPGEWADRGLEGLARTARAEEGWIEAVVPGEIHLDLMRAGLMPEPTVGNNAPLCRWPETKSWWYRTTFEVGPEFLGHERQWLVFDGLDLYAQVFVNGQAVGESANAFVPAVLDVRPCLRAGSNELVVRLTAGSELAADETRVGQEQQARPNSAAGGAVPNPAREGDLYGHRIWPGRKWLRKPQFSYGWDWVDALPNIGIWRGVRIEGRSGAVLDSLRLDTVPHGGGVVLEMEAVVENLHPWGERTCTLHVAIHPPDGAAAIGRRYDLDAPPGRTTLRDVVEVPEAKLWWPNGMGAQPLYRVAARVEMGGEVCDAREFHVGLRTIEIDRSRLSEGSRFCFRVNGQEVFCRGGNIGPQDAILARVSAAKYESLVAHAARANMNMLRINGCSIFEDGAFYDACDRAGILVWQDFMLTCTTYPETDERFARAVAAESAAAVRLLRHHPSIALWCGNNECTWGFREWWNWNKSLPLELGGEGFYNRVLPDLCGQLDPRRPYWPGSPAGGESPNSELSGDCHWWAPAFMNADVGRRIRHEVFDECRARFVSEYGVIGPCHLDSLAEYLSPEQRRPDSEAWRVHTNTFEQGTMPAAIGLHYADPETLSVPRYVLYGQMFQAILHGRAMEALRFRKHDAADDCQGALIWSYSDCWGETGWSILDYYLRRKASYYWFARACRPLKVIVRRRDGRFVTRIVNDTFAPAAVTAEWGWWRLDGGARDTQSQAVTVGPNGMLEVASAPAAPSDARDAREWLYAALLRDADAAPFDQSIWPLLPHRQLALAPPTLSLRQLPDGRLEISSPVYCHAVHVEDHGGEVLSDNWFDLLPGVPVRVRPAAGVRPADIRLEALGPARET
ncbi:MAG: hypothetical protein NTV86_14385 [Planctomycetota bacterium]|nr:hypothetical protein [Planctomycetota bacterium]